jgi:hypothetical protein
MGFEDYISAKRLQVQTEKLKAEKLKASIDKSREIFTLAGIGRSHKEYVNAETEPIESDHGVPVILRQTPHADRSGVSSYDLIFDIEGRKFVYASFAGSSGSGGIEYRDNNAHRNGYDESADDEVLAVLDLIRDEYATDAS